MTRFLLNRWIALIVALATLGLDVIASVAEAGDFHASGTYVVSQHGSHLEGTRLGRASPGGPFVGMFSGQWVAFNRGGGVGLLDFGRGDTLTYEWEASFDEATGLLLGTWTITGGTGRLSGATGSGISIATASGEFEYLGTLSY